MRSVKLFFTGSCALIVLFFLPAGCGQPKPGIWKNEQIASGKRDNFHQLNDKLLKAIKTADKSTVEGMLSADAIGGVNTSAAAAYLNQTEYVPFEDLYVVHPNLNYQNIGTDAGINTYHLRYHPITTEVYFAFFIPKTGNDKRMITIAYGKFDYGWRVYGIDVQKYALNGKTAPELYEQAKQQYAKGYLIDAINTMQLSRQCSRPSLIWLYNNERNMSDFYGTIMNEGNAKYQYPIVVENVPTKPMIFRIFSQDMSDGNYPMVYYVSHIKLADTGALRKENNELKKVIGKLIPGIDRDKKYVLYSAFNQLPSPGRYAQSFDVTDKL